MSQPLDAAIRAERIGGALLGELVDRYGAEAVVKALGVAHVAHSLGISEGITEDDDAE